MPTVFRSKEDKEGSLACLCRSLPGPPLSGSHIPPIPFSLSACLFPPRPGPILSFPAPGPWYL